MNRPKISVRFSGRVIRVFLGFMMINGSIFSLSAQNSFTISGEVIDQNNAVIVGAEISLRHENGFNAETFTNKLGNFRFTNLSKETYTLRVFARGFAVYERKIEIDAAVNAQISVVLYPTIREKVEIDEASDLLGSDASAGTITLSEEDLEIFSDDPDQFREQLEQLAAGSGGEPGRANVTVDGLQNNGRLPPKSSISQVRINPNPYSAEYQTTPRGGEIEIRTKPGAESFSGSAFFNYNEKFLNARNPFAASRAEARKSHYGLSIGGPFVKNQSGYFFSIEKRNIDEASTVNAFVLDENRQPADLTINSPSPQRLLIGLLRADWLINPRNTLIFSYGFDRQKLFGQGIGGTNLPERGFDHLQTQNSFRIAVTSVLNPRTVNEFRTGLTLNKISQTAISNRPVIDVAGAFTAGGANLQNLRRDEKILEIVNHTTLDTGKHMLKFGVQIFNNRLTELRAENRNGTFFFGGAEIFDGSNTVSISSLEQYRRTLLNLPGGVPTRFDITQGEPQVSVNQWSFGGFVQDEWKIHPKVQLSFGLRYEAQTFPTDRKSLAPRLGIAFSPDKKQNWVLRARAGIYYERIEPQLTLEALRLDGQRQRRIMIDAPSFPDPFINGTPGNATATIRILDAKLRPPASTNLRVELDRRLPAGWQIRSSYSWTIAWSELRSRNINAPLPDAQNPDPNTAPRPFGINRNILQFESSGRTEGRAFFIGLSQFRNKFFSINLGYLHLDYHTDTDGAYSLPQTSYDLRTGEWGRTLSQSNHRMFFTGRANLFWKLRLSASFNAASGRHFNITTGRDNNGDGNFNDRPGITTAADAQGVETLFGFLNPNVINGNLRRNIGISPVYVVLNLNLSRTFGFGKKDAKAQSPFGLTAAMSANNILNRSNLTGNAGVLTSPLFGRPTTSFPARQIELGLRFSF